MNKVTDKAGGTIHVVLLGILFNGYIQGEKGKKLNSSVLDEAKKEIIKALEDE